ncbi:MAG: NYN domain-containing protein, partial [Ilumatobacteraceae bacterium]
MTTTSAAHYVVDGSNIATEGRSRPSLEQLQEAVTTFMADHPDAMITVVVDATFGHRIDASERPEFDEAVANNELVAPPAGAIGRGDAFVLTIADRAGASVLSNDSFQEFHGDYEWLFDEGRLVGGKPVPHVGWVFVERTPVRGPVSRKATKKSSAPATSSRRTASKRASEPMPVPKNPPPGATTRTASGTKRASSTGEARKAGEPVNDLIPFLEFVESSPVGARVAGVVDRY